MGRAFEILSGKVVNPSTTFTTWTMATGDSNAVRNFNPGTSAYLENMWAQSATAGRLDVRSPRMHDNVWNIRLGVLAADPSPLVPEEMQQILYPQDQLIIQQTGGGSETDCGSLLVYYDDLPGAQGRFYTWEAIFPNIKNYLTVETQQTTGSTAGDYGGSVPINNNFDLLKANEDYAILGYDVSAAVCSVGWRGPDFGNLRIGGPGTTTRIETRRWFVKMARADGRSWIPVFNAANKGSTFVDLLSTATGASVVVTTHLAELGRI